jgi:hypothetical protein
MLNLRWLANVASSVEIRSPVRGAFTTRGSWVLVAQAGQAAREG